MRKRIKQINFSDVSRINYIRPIHLIWAFLTSSFYSFFPLTAAPLAVHTAQPKTEFDDGRKCNYGAVLSLVCFKLHFSSFSPPSTSSFCLLFPPFFSFILFLSFFFFAGKESNCWRKNLVKIKLRRIFFSSSFIALQLYSRVFLLHIIRVCWFYFMNLRFAWLWAATLLLLLFQLEMKSTWITY